MVSNKWKNVSGQDETQFSIRVHMHLYVPHSARRGGRNQVQIRGIIRVRAQRPGCNRFVLNHKFSLSYISLPCRTVQDALQMGSMPLPNPQSSPRRRLEKVHLMRRIARNHGKWGPSHPRYRLLEALFGFVKYRDRNMAEVDRWRKMYKRVSKKQKHVRARETAFASRISC
jgi:hypothetical protein